MFVHLTVVQRETTQGGFSSKRFLLMASGNYKMLVLEMPRRNAKKQRLAEAFIDSKKDDIAAAYISGEHERVLAIVSGFAGG